jgi:hypothetical protein
LLSGNQAQVVIQPADTTTLQGTFIHEMRVTDSNGDTQVVAIGRVLINNSFTG